MANPSSPIRKTILMLQRACIMCGTREQTPAPECKPIQYASDEPMPRGTCGRCGSRNLFVDDAMTVKLYRDPIDWAAERPRRGRPPKALVEQRRMEQERERLGKAS
jgi:hypothetical protein